MTNAEKIRSMSDEQLAQFLDRWDPTGVFPCRRYDDCGHAKENRCWECIGDWFAEEG